MQPTYTLMKKAAMDVGMKPRFCMFNRKDIVNTINRDASVMLDKSSQQT
jgi:hypothetical protein